MRWNGAILILSTWVWMAAGCLLPKYSVGGRSPDAGVGGVSGAGEGGMTTGAGGTTASGGAGGMGTGGTTASGGAGGSNADAGGNFCPTAPTSTFDRVWDFATANQDFINEATGSLTVISTDGCPAPGALDVVAQLSPTDDMVIVDTTTQPAVSLTHEILSARVKLVKGTVTHLELFAKTGPCAIYSNGAPLFTTVGSGWQLLTLDPANLAYHNTDCYDPVQCAPTLGSSCYDAGDVTELGISVTAPPGQTLELFIDTVGYGQ